MTSVIFSYNGRETTIQCQAQNKMADICQKFSSKIDIDIDQIYFISKGNQLNLDLTFFQLSGSVDKNSNVIKILVYDKLKTIIKDNKKNQKK